MGVHFQSNCDWRFTEGRRRGAASELPQRVHTWTGRYDQLETFLDTYPLGALHEGGYIVDRDIRDTAPRAEVDLILAYEPDFTADRKSPFTATKVFEKTAEVTDADLIPGADSLQATRKLTARCFGTRYRYFSETEPADSRHSSTSFDKNPKILSDFIEVVGKFSDGTEQKLTYASRASAPASVQSAIDMDLTNSVEDFSATSIDGTPWFDCSDAVLKGYEVAD